MADMTRISSKYLFLTKKGFPLLWFGFLAFFIAESVAYKAYEEDVVFIVMPILMTVVGFLVMKKMVWDLVDEVHDGGDFLVVRNRGVEDRVFLSNIMNVNASMYMNPKRITLRLAKPGKFGNEISFSPASSFSFNPFAKNRVAEDLIVRVDAARAKRAR